MKRKRLLLMSIGLIFFLLLGTLLYIFLRDDNPNRYFTGLGEDISLAPDDSKIAFSYYVDGKESIYTADINGTNVEELTNTTNLQHRSPVYSPNGDKLIYLSEDNDGIQTLRIINEDESEGRQLTESDLHVTDAIFSRNGETIIFVGIEAEEYKKGEESRAGVDLFSIEPDGGSLKKLTNADHYFMNNLFLSPDGNTLYYSEFDGDKEGLYSYTLEGDTIVAEPSSLSGQLINTGSLYEPELSPDGKLLAFTDVSDESKESSLFNYDLFLQDLNTNTVERLTDLESAVTSPVFFHQQHKIAFLENTNWAASPAVYQLMTVDLATHEIEAVQLDAPQSAGGMQFIRMLDGAANTSTLGILYILLIGLLSVYLHYYHPRKVYVPSLISLVLAVTLFAANFVVAARLDPWYGIGLGMLSAGIFGCSAVVLLFVFIYRRFAK